MALCVWIMRRVPLLAGVFAAAYVLFRARYGEPVRDGLSGTSVSPSSVIHLAVVACEGKTKRVLHEATTMIKSSLIFTKSPLHIHIFTETLETDFEQVEVLQQIDSLIYVDTDVLFLTPVDELWGHFLRFGEEHVGALAPRVGWEFNVPSSSPNFIRKPDGKMTQVNSGVFLMNLTRMRESRFATSSDISMQKMSWNQNLLVPLYRANKKDMYGDQNLINVVFHYNPELLYYLPCNLNYHHKFCFDKEENRVCDSAEKEGAAVVHGSANTFYNNYSPAFAAVNNAVRQYNFEKNLEESLLDPMLLELKDPKVDRHDHCGGKMDLFTKQLRKSIGNKIRGL